MYRQRNSRGERVSGRDRDYPAGRNERQRRREMEWEDGRTGLFYSGSTA